MAFDLARVQAAVERDRTVNESAVTLLSQLAQLLRDNAANETAILQLADQLDVQQQSLADAVTANTPSAPPTP